MSKTILTDRRGATVPQRLRKVFQAEELFRRLGRHAQLAGFTADQLASEPAGEHMDRGIRHLANQLLRRVRASTPWLVCESCGGAGKKCQRCGGKGFLTRAESRLRPGERVLAERRATAATET